MTTTAPEKTGLKIAQLQAENFKKLRVVSFSPDPTSSTIGGDNGQGKTSLLDAIAVAIGGTKMAPEEPIRMGTERSDIRMQLTGKVGDMPVTYNLHRAFKRNGDKTSSELIITTPDGTAIGQPQTILNNLLGAAGAAILDPLEFAHKKPADQAATLRNLVGLDFTDLDAKRKTAYDERTLVNKEIEALKARNTGAVEHQGVPDEEQSAAEVQTNLETANNANQAYHYNKAQLEDVTRRVGNQINEIEALKATLRGAEKVLEQLQEIQATAQSALNPCATVDTTPILAELAALEDTNRKVRENKALKAARETWTEVQEKKVALNTELDQIDNEKANQLAKAVFPIDGLGFAEDGITFNGIPFEQASASEQIKVSTAIALALAGDIRVILVRDASLLDRKSRQAMIDQAEAAGAQLFLELVGSEGEMTLCLEDGEVAGSSLGL